MLLYSTSLGLECQRPKHQNSSENDIEVISTGTPDSSELHMKGTTPPDLTPDQSPSPSRPATPPSASPSKPTHHTKNARFLRQTAVDDDRGTGEIQVLVEGRGGAGAYMRPNSRSEEKRLTAVGPSSRGGSRGSSRSNTPSVQEDTRARSSNGHKQASSNHKPRERWSDCPSTVSWATHRSHSETLAQSRLLEQDEEKLSNYEMEMKPLKRMDSYMQETHSQKHHAAASASGNAHGFPSPAKDNHSEPRAFGVQRTRDKCQPKLSVQPVLPPTVQKLDSCLRLGDKFESSLHVQIKVGISMEAQGAQLVHMQIDVPRFQLNE
ncbi:UNVERIFIED_CONTAM: hypothetical protein FKN15_067828 [Acipenser sinensis]